MVTSSVHLHVHSDTSGAAITGRPGPRVTPRSVSSRGCKPDASQQSLLHSALGGVSVTASGGQDLPDVTSGLVWRPSPEVPRARAWLLGCSAVRLGAVCEGHGAGCARSCSRAMGRCSPGFGRPYHIVLLLLPVLRAPASLTASSDLAMTVVTAGA